MNNLLSYARPLADEPTMRMVAVLPEPTHDEVEGYIIQQLEALFSVPCPRGLIPFTTKTHAEQRAEFASELLSDLHTYRRVRADSANKIKPKKRKKWERA